MSVYKAETLFTGYKLGLKTNKTFVGVPRQKLKEDCVVLHDNQRMVIKKGTKPKTKKRFDDKFIVGKKYWLHYFIWKPEVKEPDQTMKYFEAKHKALGDILRQKGLIK